MTLQMKCPEYHRLLTLYADATGALRETTCKLTQVAISYESDAFARAWERCETARKLCGDIRRQMYQHLEGHHCALNLHASARAKSERAPSERAMSERAAD